MKFIAQNIYIRPLTGNDIQTYRALRQRILDLGDGSCFSDSYIREKNLQTDDAWSEWCTETPDHCIFGTFDNDELIGVMMVTRYDGFGDRTVEWEAVWLDPRYRRLGIGKCAYELAQQWTETQGYNRVVGFIRADNDRAREIFERLGGRYICTKYDEVWADGSIANVHTFLLDLHSMPLRARQLQALHQFNKVALFDEDRQKRPDIAAAAASSP